MPMTTWDAAWPDLEAWAKPSVDMVPHTGQLTELASGAHLIVEFGVRSGVSTLALLNGLPATGRMVSVDINADVVNWMHPALRADPRFTLLIGDALDPEIIAKLPADPDILMIDAGHGYEETLGELALGVQLKAKRIVLHDYLYTPTDPSCRVREAVDEFMTTAPFEWETLHQSMWGLAVLRKT